jgi:hypothetical protein
MFFKKSSFEMDSDLEGSSGALSLVDLNHRNSLRKKKMVSIGFEGGRS